MKKGEATHYRVFEENPEMKKIDSIVHLLKEGGVIIYPTDTVYAMGCDLFNRQAIHTICRIKGIKPSKAIFSLIGDDISQMAEYAKNLATPLYKIMKKATPGPFTFILQASNSVPRSLDANRKTIGLRIPDNNIPRVIARTLGNPLVTTSIRDEDEVIEYVTDPDLIYEKYAKEVDAVIDGGIGKNVASTIVDCTEDELKIIREGLGDFYAL